MTDRTFALAVLLLAGGVWWTWGLVAAWRARGLRTVKESDSKKRGGSGPRKPCGGSRIVV